jgi:putative colanic acid biosynthesis acetyltransferase WcaF
LWNVCWNLFCAWTPKPLNFWRLFWLKIFGCRITGFVYVHPRARVEVPWNLTMDEGSCLGDGTVVYSLGPIEIGRGATIAQECYLCTGTHDFSDPKLPLMTSKIVIGEDAFLGVRALVLPGVSIGPGTVIGAGSVVTKDMPAWTICAGNPCAPIKDSPRKPGQ